MPETHPMPRGPLFKNRTGKRFGRLVVIAFAFQKKNHSYWLCRCDCGNEKVIAGTSLTPTHTRSCGCLQSESARARCQAQRTHGMTDTKIHEVWMTMIQRCTNPRSQRYALYGGRGICVCERWKTFINFLADMGEKPEGMSIERINNDGNYEPGNCRWADQFEQTRNTRVNINISFGGRTQCVSAWAEEIGMNYITLYERLKRGWSVERALTKPLRGQSISPATS